MVYKNIKSKQLIKEAIFGLSALAGQIGSNAAVKFGTSGKFGRSLGASYANAALLKRVPKSSYGLAAVSGYAPEFEMGLSSVGNIAKGLASDKKYKPLRRYASVLGKKTGADIMAWQSSPKSKRQNAYMLKRLFKNQNPVVNKMIINSNIGKALINKSPLVRSGIIKDLVHVKDSYGITKNVIPATINRANEILLNRANISKLKPGSKIGPKIVSGLSIAATATFDPISAGWSGFKRFIGSSAFGKTKFVGGIQKKLQNVFVTNRSKRLFNLGNSGREIPFKKTKRALDNYLLNPITSDIKNMSYDLGKLNFKYSPKFRETLSRQV